jgi:hypothetical protein
MWARRLHKKDYTGLQHQVGDFVVNPMFQDNFLLRNFYYDSNTFRFQDNFLLRNFYYDSNTFRFSLEY